MRIAICDDEKLFLENTRYLIEKWSIERNMNIDIFLFSNGDDLLHAHKKNYMDLIVLDVIMPLLNGIDTAKELRSEDNKTPIIFLTSSREFAVESYDVNAFYYLLKPLDKEKLFRVLDSFIALAEKNENTFTARTADGFRKININDILYMEAQNKLVDFFLHDGTKIEVHELFSKCEEFFSKEKLFFKCHRSYIVNFNYVTQFTKTDIRIGTVSIPISRNRYSNFKEAYFDHMFKI